MGLPAFSVLGWHVDTGHGLAPYGLGALVVFTLLTIHRGVRARWSLALPDVLFRIPALVLVTFLLASPTRERSSEREGMIHLALDLSPSVDEASRAEAVGSLLSGEPTVGLRTVAFGGGDAPSEWGSVQKMGSSEQPSDPTAALAALILHPSISKESSRVVLICDDAVSGPRAGLGHLSFAHPPYVLPIQRSDAEAPQMTGVRVMDEGSSTESRPLQVRGVCPQPERATFEVLIAGIVHSEMAFDLAAGPFDLQLPGPQLSPGVHWVGVRMVRNDVPRAPAPLAGTLVEVGAPRGVCLVSDDGEGPLARALTAQAVPFRRLGVSEFLAQPETAEDAETLVLDRVSTRDLSRAEVLAALDRHLDRGGGFLFLPREDAYELVPESGKEFISRLPVLGVPPPPPQKEDPPPDEDPQPQPGDPTEADEPPETREVPSLGLLLLIDSSASMREESRLLLAIEAAIAAADVLHPEDMVGVIQFNTKASAVLELTKAGNKEMIADRISRIEARGGTAFAPPLELAREIFAATQLGVRHAILLSDGDSRPYPLKPLVTALTEEGITLSTVGCGPESNEQTLSDLAYWGRGKFLPAHNAKSVPQIFTVEARRVIRETGARSRGDGLPPQKPDPETKEPAPPDQEDERKPQDAEPSEPKAMLQRTAWPAPYLSGVPLHETPGVYGYHPCTVQPWAWTSLQTVESAEPLLAHAYVGRGRVIAATTPWSGPWAAPMLLLPEYGVLLAQCVRFLSPERSGERFFVSGEQQGREITVHVEDRWADALPADVSLALIDGSEAPIPMEATRISDSEFRVVVPTYVRGGVAMLRVRSEERSGNGSLLVRIPESAEWWCPPPPGARLEAWATALGGDLVNRENAFVAPTYLHREVLVPGQEWFVGLLLLLCIDFLVRRWSGQW